MSETFSTQSELLPRNELAKIAGESVAARRTNALEQWQRQSLVITPDAVTALEAEIAVVRAEAEAADALAGEAKTLALEAQITADTAEATAEEALAAATARFHLTATATEALTAGDFVHVYDSSGAKVQLANATDLTKPCNGYVLDTVSNGSDATVYVAGENDKLTGLTVGATYWLDTTGGAITVTPPGTAGNLDQIVGIATDTTKLAFTFTPGIGV